MDLFGPEKTLNAVGWIAQAQVKYRDRNEPVWVSWTQWKERDKAIDHAQSLLARKNVDGKILQTRVVRVDWTITETFEPHA